MKTIKPCLDILPPEQRQYWNLLSPIQEKGFVLYGGTAIALQIGHRKSIDFDFFSSKPFDYEALRKELNSSLPFLKDAKLEQAQINTLTLTTADRVQFSFFGNINFGRVGTPSQCEDNGLVLASLDDLFALKLATILKRIEYKDYFDIAKLLEMGMSLENGLNNASALYKEMFLPIESMRALSYFDSPELKELTNNEKQTIINAIKTTNANNLVAHEKLSEFIEPIQEKPRKRMRM